MYDGVISQKRLEEFTPLVKKSITTHVNDLITSRIKSALSNEKKERESLESKDEEENTIDSRVVTTEEEMEGYMIVKAIVREICDVNRIVYRDAISYFSILFDDNNRKPICRLYFNGNQKYIMVFDENKESERFDLDSLNDIFKCADKLKNIAAHYSK